MKKRQNATRWLGQVLACATACPVGHRILCSRLDHRNIRVWLSSFWWAVAVGSGVTLQADQFSFTKDFLLWPSQSNAPTNTWQYFYGVNPTNRTGSYQRLPYFATGRESPLLTNVQHWAPGAGLFPYIGKNTGPRTSTGINPGEGYVHPSNDRLGLAVGFRVPATSVYNVSGYVRAADVAGNGIRWYLDKGTGANSLAEGTVPVGTTNTFAQSRIRLAAGEFLYLIVDANGSYYGDSAGVAFLVEMDPAPVVIGQPLSRTNAVGSTAGFLVEVLGTTPLHYQWRRQGTNLADGGTISGVTTTNLQIANVQPADAAGYSVVVTNTYGSATSSVAQLTVVSPGRFTNFTSSPVMGFSFIFRDATVGRPYRIQRSASLAEGSWVDWQSFTYTEPLFLTDMGATGQARRFYRAVSP